MRNPRSGFHRLFSSEMAQQLAWICLYHFILIFGERLLCTTAQVSYFSSPNL